MAWNEDNKIKLTISGSLINEDLTNFPLTITIASGVGTNNIDTTEVFDELTTSGTRKRIAIFYGGDQNTGSKCYTEIEHWDSVNETATLHTQVPTLTSGTDTDLYLYYDITQPDQDYRLNSEANDDFTGTNGDPPDPSRWRNAGDLSASIQNNKLRMTANSGYDSSVYSRYYLEGDFDAQIDFECIDHPSTDYWELGFLVQSSDHRVYMLREYNTTDRYRSLHWTDGVGYENTQTQNQDDLTGQLRITRTGGQLKTYYYDSGWQNLMTTLFSDGTEDLEIWIYMWSGGSNPTGTIDLDNFTVSGTITGFVDDTGGKPSQEMWDANFLAVHHHAQDPSGGADAIKDSTKYGNHGTAYNMDSGDLIDATAGKGLDYDTNEYVDLKDESAVEGLEQVTLEALYKPDVLTATAYLIAKYGASSSPFYALRTLNLVTDSSGQLTGDFIGDEATPVRYRAQSSDTLTEDQDYYVASFFEAGQSVKLRINDAEPSYGTQDTVPAGTKTNANTTPLEYGRYSGGPSGYLDALVSEVRISNIRRTDTWSEVTYYSLFDDLIFYDLLIPTPSGEVLPDAEGWTKVGETLTSGIVVRLYRRDTGELVGEDVSATVSGTWNIPTTYDEYHYAVALYTTSGTNALIYDWLHPTLNL